MSKKETTRLELFLQAVKLSAVFGRDLVFTIRPLGYEGVPKKHFILGRVNSSEESVADNIENRMKTFRECFDDSLSVCTTFYAYACLDLFHKEVSEDCDYRAFYIDDWFLSSGTEGVVEDGRSD